jgi:hypothetical protein
MAELSGPVLRHDPGRSEDRDLLARVNKCRGSPVLGDQVWRVPWREEIDLILDHGSLHLLRISASRTEHGRQVV